MRDTSRRLQSNRFEMTEGCAYLVRHCASLSSHTRTSTHSHTQGHTEFSLNHEGDIRNTDFNKPLELLLNSSNQLSEVVFLYFSHQFFDFNKGQCGLAGVPPGSAKLSCFNIDAKCLYHPEIVFEL